MSSRDNRLRPRTHLVSVFGWVMMCVGVLSALLFGLFGGLLAIAMKTAEGELLPAEDLAELPVQAAYFLDNLNIILAISILASLLMAVAGFGIVKRWEWGRQLCVILLAMSIVASVVGVVMGFRGPAESTFLMALYNIGLALLTAVLHGWLIWKLRTPEIRGEFVETRSESPS